MSWEGGQSAKRAMWQSERLQRDGVAVVPCPVWFEERVLPHMSQWVDRTLQGMPEYRNAQAARVAGGFAALGNPSSFHNPLVRRLREWAHATLVPLWSAFLAGDASLAGHKLEQVIDRMLCRERGQAPSAESWHRDEAELALDTDVVFGGWWNLDTTEQYFSCVPGSHTGVSGHRGFHKLSPEERKAAAAQAHLITIPPGALLVFNELILHQIVGRPAKQRMHRLFLGWRLTESNEPLYPDLLQRLQTQAIMPLKSGQLPPMYPKLYWTNHRHKLAAFSAGFKDVCASEQTVQSGEAKGQTLRVVHRFMGSLQEYDFPSYKKWKHNEIAMHVPNRSWELHYGSHNHRTVFSL